MIFATPNAARMESRSRATFSVVIYGSSQPNFCSQSLAYVFARLMRTCSAAALAGMKFGSGPEKKDGSQLSWGTEDPTPRGSKPMMS